MPRKKERTNDSLALRSAHARHRHWAERLVAAEAIGNDELAREASRFIAEYEDFINELEQQTDLQAIVATTSSLPSAPAAALAATAANPPQDVASLAAPDLP